MGGRRPPRDLEPDFLLGAYAAGYFPMDDGRRSRGAVRWYEPDPRAVLLPETFRVPRSVERAVRRCSFAIRVDGAFEEVIAACAPPREPRDGVWISDRFVRAYSALHRLGYARSFEAWDADALVGGLYGVALGRAFMAESMFHRAPGAGHAVLVGAVRWLFAAGVELFDVQFATPHLERFGVVEIAREEYRERLARALRDERA